MYAIFDTLELAEAKMGYVNSSLGYPSEETKTITYSIISFTANGKYCIYVSEHVAHLFTGCTILDSVEFPGVTDEETI